ncbi:MAG: PIN domain-containing protein [Candidatus Hydrogenedentes bacterium]|nr:PIN domain-containing protein [Candidatus Hydrogenedentota bacterium]
MDKLVLLDTSAWVNYFRKEPRTYALVNRLIADARVCLARIILAELMQGAKSQKEITTVRNLPAMFAILEEQPETWENAGLLSNRFRQQGKTIGLADCYIAILAKTNGVDLLTEDKDFKTLQPEVGISLFSVVDHFDRKPAIE